MRLVIIVLFILGTMFGSLWSVLSSRLEALMEDENNDTGDAKDTDDNKNARKKESTWSIIKGILRWRSHCPQCWHALWILDLFPLVSYLSTGGKCRYCKKKIPSMYVWREIGSWLVFALVGGILLSGFGIWFITLWGIATWDAAARTIVWLIVLRLLASRLAYLLLIYDIQTMYLHMPIRILLIITTVLFVGNSALLAWNARYYGLVRSWIFFLFFLALYWFAKMYATWRFWEKSEGFWSWDVMIAPLLWAQFGIRERLLQVNSMIQGESFLWLPVTQHFLQYIIITGILWLLYAWIHKIVAPKGSVRSIPFLPGMIVWIWVMMALTYFGIL